MSKTAGANQVPVTGPWGSSVARTFPTRRKTGNRPWNAWSVTKSKLVEAKYKPLAANAKLEPGNWRDPTSFRSYVAKVTSLRGYSYEGYTSSSKVWHEGPESYLPDTGAYSSMFVAMSGAGNFPMTNANTTARALTECLNKLKAADLNLSEAIATVDQTLGMLAGALIELYASLRTAHKFLKGDSSQLKALRSALQSSRRGVRRKLLAKVNRATTNRWLEYQYGWHPLMQDIKTIVEALKDQSKKFNGSRVSATRNVSYEESLPAFYPQSVGALAQVQGSITSGAKVRLDAVITDLDTYLLDKVGLANFGLLLWEIVPFSFVIDWIMPIGNVIQAFSAGLGLTFLGGSQTVYTKAELDVTWTAYGFTSGSPLGVKIQSLTNWRTTFLSMPMPKFYMKDLSSSLTRVATAYSLLSQLAAGRTVKY